MGETRPPNESSIGAVRWLMFFSVGLFPWLVVNGIFAELAVFNRILPEGKSLSSQAGAICQVANVGLVYVWLRHRYGEFISISKTMWLLLGLSFVSCVVLSFAWNVTVGGVSVVLFSTTFTGGIVGIVGLTVIYPWASRFPPSATSAVSTGTASSGLLAGLIGFFQGAGAETLNFSPFVFILLLGVFTLLSCVMFYILEHEALPLVSKHTPLLQPTEEGIEEGGSLGHKVDGVARDEDVRIEPRGWWHVFQQAKMPVCVQLFNCLFNYAFIPGIIPFLLCGNIPTFWLQEVVTLSNVLGRWASTFFYHTDDLLPWMTAAMGILLGLSIALAAATNKSGLFLEISAYVGVFIFGWLNGYIESLVFLVPGRRVGNANLKERALQLLVIMGQVGALTGTFTTAGVVATRNFRQC